MHRQPADDSHPEDGLTFPHANIQAIADLSNVLASSFGPTPRDKLIINQLAAHSEDDPRVNPATDDYTVTSDGATIIEELDFDHPIAPVIERVTGPERPGESDIEGKDITDGIKISVLLLSNLLTEARSLLDKSLHPATIQTGYRHALEVSTETLSTAKLDPTDSNIQGVARTALTGNDVGGNKDQWARMAIDAVKTVGVPNHRTFAVRTASGRSINDSRFVRGTVLNKNERASDKMPRQVEDANILVMGGAEDGGLKRKETRREVSVNPSDPEYASAFENLRDRHRQERLESILTTETDVVVAETGISKQFQELLSENGIIGVRRVNSQKLRQVALATGATIVYDPDDISSGVLGTAGLVEEIKIPEFWTERGDRRMMVFDQCPEPESVSILLTGVWRQIADQLTTSIRKSAFAAAVARGEGKYTAGCLPGGGAADIIVARKVRESAPEFGTKAQLAIAAFSDAVEQVVGTLAHNGGLDPASAVSNIQSLHSDGADHTGLALPEGDLVNVVEAGILEPYESKRRAYETATEVANIVINIDDALDATFEDTPITPDEAIDDDAAERHMDYLEKQDKETRWG